MSAKRLRNLLKGIGRLVRHRDPPAVARTSSCLTKFGKPLFHPRLSLMQENDFSITVAGTLTGLMAVLVEELEKAGSLSRTHILQRLETFFEKGDQGAVETPRPNEWLERAIVSEFLKILAQPSNHPFKLSIVAGTEATLAQDDPT